MAGGMMSPAGARNQSLVAEMGPAYRRPRAAMARQLAAGLSEGRALFHLGLACILLCVASVPSALERAASIDADDPVNAAIAAQIFGFIVLLPMIAYGLAALMRGVSRLIGGSGSGLAMRSALFWSMLLAAPIALLLAAFGSLARSGVEGVASVSVWIGYVALGYWFWLLAAAVAESERFRTRSVFLVFCLLFGLVAVALRGAL